MLCLFRPVNTIGLVLSPLYSLYECADCELVRMAGPWGNERNWTQDLLIISTALPSRQPLGSKCWLNVLTVQMLFLAAQLQEADRGGWGDRSHEPGQVQEGPGRAGRGWRESRPDGAGTVQVQGLRTVKGYNPDARTAGLYLNQVTQVRTLPTTNKEPILTPVRFESTHRSPKVIIL